LLMPAQRVRREAHKLGPVLSDEAIERLAKRFEVSAAAMAIRLQVLKLLHRS
jgi:Zn-dependent peptidase ImmA (M78 family)